MQKSLKNIIANANNKDKEELKRMEKFRKA